MRVVCLVDRVRELSRTRARTGGPKAKRQYNLLLATAESQYTDLTMPRMAPTTNTCQSPLHIPSYRHSYPNWPASAPSAASRLRASNHHPPPLEEVKSRRHDMLINTTPSLHKPQSINMPPQPPPSRRPRSSCIPFLVLVLLPFLAHAFTPLPSLARYPFSGQAPTPRATHHLSSLAALPPLRSSLRIVAASGRFVWMGNCIPFLPPVLSSSLSSPEWKGGEVGRFTMYTVYMPCPLSSPIFFCSLFLPFFLS